MEEKIFIKASDNLGICGIWGLPEVSNDKAVILAHGISVDKDEEGLFVNLSKRLTELNYSVLRFDFSGHGQSQRKSVDLTISQELTDMDAAFNEVKSKKFHNISILGASFGGGIAVMFAARHQKYLNNLLLWYPVLNYDHTFLKPYLPWLKDRIERMKQELAARGWTTINNEKPFKIGKKLFDEMNRYFPYRDLKKIAIPTVIIHGDKDTYVPYNDSKEYLKNLKGESELITIKGADHGFDGKNDILFKHQAIEKTIKVIQKYL